MRRAIVAVVGVAVLAIVSMPWWTPSPAEVSASVVGSTGLETASFEPVSKPPRPIPPPTPKFTRAIYASVKLAGSSVMLDACHGPIAVDLGDNRPVLVAEHNYCGGLAWMPKLGMDDAVKLSGDGVESGTYVVTEVRFQIRRQARVRDLPRTDIVLQTCVTKDKLILVGMDKFDPTLAS